MKKFFKDFSAFIMKGNVLDLAVGIIIGGAFNKIVSSLVNDVIMPVISLLTKGDISGQFFVLRGEAAYNTNPDTGLIELYKDADAVLLYWGKFVQSIIDFLIIGLTLFIIIKIVIMLDKRREKRKAQIKAKLQKSEPVSEAEKEVVPPEPVIPEDILLLREIRDTLKKDK